MTKSEQISLIGTKQPHLNQKDAEFAINSIIQTLTNAIANGVVE